jgi:septal ring factor EnvC (AmiA/AmiB activator)
LFYNCASRFEYRDREVGTALKWLKKIFSKEKGGEDPGVEAPLTLALSHVGEWLRGRSQEPEFEERVRSLYDTIERVAKNLEGDLLALERAEPKEGVPPRLLKAGSAAREKVTRQMAVLSDRLSPPLRADTRSAEEYHSAMMKHLQNTVQKFGRAQRYTAALFPREVEMINSDLGAISRHLSDLGDEVQERKERLEKFVEAADLASQVRERRDQIEALKDEISGDEDLLATLRDRERGHQKEIESWTRSDEGKRNLDERKAQEKKLRERDQIEMSMADLVSPLTKAISRIVKQDDSDRIVLQHRGVFEQLSSSPARALEGDVSGALLELKSKADLLGLRDKKRERIIEQIDHLLEDRPLEVLKARHLRLQDEIEELERNLSKSSRETARLKEKRNQVRQRIQAQEAAIEERKRSLAALEERLSGDLADLKITLEDISEGPVEIDVRK